MILIFAGAGASKAVDSDTYPTTVEFFERLPDTVQQDKLFLLACDYLRNVHGRDTVLDIEQVLWVLDELANLLRQSTDQKSVAGWFLHGSRILQPLGTRANFTSIVGNAKRLLDLHEKIVGAINRQVYEWYSRLPSEDAIAGTWLPLLAGLFDVDSRLEVFTTNYDLIIEMAACMWNSQKESPSINIGHTPGFQRQLDTSLWSPPPRGTTIREDAGGLLTKLHGSVDWSRQDDHVFISDPYYKGDDTRHAILYPGFKGAAMLEPFSSFHAHFEAAVAAASRLLFIGFAFRDENINSLLEKATPPRAQITILDPAESLGQAPFDPSRIQHVQKPFDKGSIAECLELFQS